MRPQNDKKGSTPHSVTVILNAVKNLLIENADVPLGDSSGATHPLNDRTVCCCEAYSVILNAVKNLLIENADVPIVAALLSIAF